MFTIFKLSIPALFNSCKFSSFKSLPADKIISLLLSIMSEEIYFPNNSSLETNISFKFFSANFLAMIILSFSPFERIFLFVFASTKSNNNFIGLL